MLLVETKHNRYAVNPMDVSAIIRETLIGDSSVNVSLHLCGGSVISFTIPKKEYDSLYAEWYETVVVNLEGFDLMGELND